MRNRTIVLITTILILVATTALITYGVIQANLATLSNAIPYSLSILAFFISILSSFREELFPFRLSIFTTALHLTAGELFPPLSGKGVFVLLPITFSNSGYSEGIIQSVKLIVKSEKNQVVHEFLPAVEVDMAVLSKEGLNVKSILCTFVGFIIEPRKSIKKDIVFIPKSAPNVAPFRWQPDIYAFEVHVKVNADKKSRKYSELKQEIHNNVLLMLDTGKFKTIHLMTD